VETDAGTRNFGRPAPHVSRPELWQQMQRRFIGPAVDHSDSHQSIFGVRLCVFDRHIEIAPLIEHAGIIDFEFRFVPGALGDWNTRQYKSDVSTERSQRHRQQQCNVAATAEQRRGNGSEQNRENRTEHATAGLIEVTDQIALHAWDDYSGATTGRPYPRNRRAAGASSRNGRRGMKLRCICWGGQHDRLELPSDTERSDHFRG
jgi:hypothetical protein